MLRLALLVSGSGTTMKRIIDECRSGKLKGRIDPALVITNRPHALAVRNAIFSGVPGECVVKLPRSTFDSSEEYGAALIDVFKRFSIDLIGQYGWMVHTPSRVIETYCDRMINQHPGPLDPGRPDFGGKGMYGRRVHCARLYFSRTASRDLWTEATAQRVATEYDKGAVLRTLRIPILPKDTTDTLAKRLLPVEHEVQIETLLDFANNRVNEIARDKPLVRQNETELLNQAKHVAATLYPNG